MTKPIFLYQTYIETISTHLRAAHNSHPNQKASYINAALKSLDKLSTELFAQLSLIQENEPLKKGDYKPNCELCGCERVSIKSFILGHRTSHYVCKSCFTLNESIKLNMNSSLPRDSHLKLMNFTEQLAKLGYVDKKFLARKEK